MSRSVRRTRFLLMFSLVALFVSCRGAREEQDKGPEPREVVVCSYGGAFQEAQRKAFFEPFEEETGIVVREAQWSGEYGKLKAMVIAGKPSWDLVTTAEASTIARGAKEGILEPIDYTGIDKDSFFPDALTDYSVGFDYFSTAMAYNSNDRERPSNWREFWDTDRFPGRRSLRNDPRTTLEFALLADGVEKDELYPLDVDRAFRSLDKIRPYVGVWWTTGSQPAQLLADGEVRYASAFNGRIWAAAVNDGLPLAVEWTGGALDTDAWVIPKGAKNREEALALIRFTARPEVQLALTRYISYGPTVREAYDRLSPEQRAVLPSSPENRALQFVYDGTWWAENESAVQERWTQWQLGG